MSETTAALPLSGVRVLDVASFIAAPVAATVMADYGAEVIKVEPPRTGDPNRSMRALASYPPSAVNYPWEMDSRGKRSIVLDLTKPAGREVLYRLAEGADVLITNYPSEVRAKLKMAYEDIAPRNGRLIYASFTGYGETGPDAHLVGFDSTAYFARSGLMDACRYEGQPPGVVQPAQGDRSAAMALFGGIMLALWNRERTGRGTLVTSSLIANGLWANGVGAQAALLGSVLPHRPPRDRPRNAITNYYRLADDRWIMLTIVREEAGWPSLCRAVGLPALEHDPLFATLPLRRKHSAELTAILDPLFGARDWAWWRARLAEFSIPVGLINRLEDLPEDAQARASGAVVATANPAMPLTLAAPFGLADAPVPPAQAAPGLGEHTEAVLREAGVAAGEVERWREGGAFG